MENKTKDQYKFLLEFEMISCGNRWLEKHDKEGREGFIEYMRRSKDQSPWVIESLERYADMLEMCEDDTQQSS